MEGRATAEVEEPFLVVPGARTEGGGILVDNGGPQETEYDGQGYGGGGGGNSYDGNPGLVLLEIKPKQ